MEKIKAFKGTDNNLQCRNYQFEVGKEHTEDQASLCNKGFHACEYPLDVFGYYPPSDSRYFEVELNAMDESSNDTKRVGKSIKLTAEIGVPGIIKAAIEYIKERVDWENAEATNTGYQSAATNTGDYSAATNTGYQSAATAEGKDSVAIVTGKGSKARGEKGCVLFLIERNDDWEIISHASIQIDGKKYKEMVYYTLSGGEVKEVNS